MNSLHQRLIDYSNILRSDAIDKYYNRSTISNALHDNHVKMSGDNSEYWYFGDWWIDIHTPDETYKVMGIHGVVLCVVLLSIDDEYIDKSIEFYYCTETNKFKYLWWGDGIDKRIECATKYVNLLLEMGEQIE